MDTTNNSRPKKSQGVEPVKAGNTPTPSAHSAHMAEVGSSVALAAGTGKGQQHTTARTGSSVASAAGTKKGQKTYKTHNTRVTQTGSSVAPTAGTSRGSSKSSAFSAMDSSAGSSVVKAAGTSMGAPTPNTNTDTPPAGSSVAKAAGTSETTHHTNTPDPSCKSGTKPATAEPEVHRVVDAFADEWQMPRYKHRGKQGTRPENTNSKHERSSNKTGPWRSRKTKKERRLARKVANPDAEKQDGEARR